MVAVVDLSAGCEFLSSPIAPPIVAFQLLAFDATNVGDVVFGCASTLEEKSNGHE